MARCVCCGCITDEDCCTSGYYYNNGVANNGCPTGLVGPFETGAECAAAIDACFTLGPLNPRPFCFCQGGDFECCDDGTCQETCEEESPPP